MLCAEVTFFHLIQRVQKLQPKDLDFSLAYVAKNLGDFVQIT